MASEQGLLEYIKRLEARLAEVEAQLLESRLRQSGNLLFSPNHHDPRQTGSGVFIHPQVWATAGRRTGVVEDEK